MLNYFKFPLGDVRRRFAGEELSTFNLQLSTFNLQLSTFNLQLSTFNLPQSPITFLHFTMNLSASGFCFDSGYSLRKP